MSRGTKILILIAGGVIVIGLIVYFVFVPLFMSGEPTANTNAPSINSNQPVGGANNQEQGNKITPPAELSITSKAMSAARTIAQTFAVRLNTYSNQNGLSNLSDLEAITTPAVWSYINGEYRVELEKAMPSATNYYGVTSTAANVNMSVVSDTEMTATIPMLKVESGSKTETSYPILDLKLKFVNGAWLVSWLEWKE